MKIQNGKSFNKWEILKLVYINQMKKMSNS